MDHVFGGVHDYWVPYWRWFNAFCGTFMVEYRDIDSKIVVIAIHCYIINYVKRRFLLFVFFIFLKKSGGWS